MEKYSVLSYIIGGYDTIKPILYKSPNAEYILVTDNKELKSDDWNIIYVDNFHPEDNFDLCYKIRFNPFVFVNTNIVLRIDASIQIVDNTDYLIEEYINGGYDVGLMIHPSRNTMMEEYRTWINCRQYPIEQANKCLTFMALQGYDIENYKGLYQYCAMIQRNNKMNDDWNSLTLSYLKYLAQSGKRIERLDQTIGSFVLNKFFNGYKIMAFSQDILRGKPFQWCQHHTGTKLNVSKPSIEPYLFNNPVNIFQ